MVQTEIFSYVVLPRDPEDTSVTLRFDFPAISIEARVSLDNIPPPKYWLSRRQLQAAEAEAMERWMRLNEEERSEVIRLIRSAMANMHDTIEDWIPAGWSIDDVGDDLCVEFHFLSTELRRRLDIRDEVDSWELNRLAQMAAKLAERTPLPEG